MVAEDVETAEQYGLLERAECDSAQGFYLSPPIAAADLEEVLASLELRVFPR
jgi:EAL domain-containing protein (putative c-di-GMP-specific phosphodiesterase class I)